MLIDDTGPARDPRPTIFIISTNADRAGAPVHVRDVVLSLQNRYRFIVVFGEDGPIREILAATGIETHVIASMRSVISPMKDVGVVRTLREHIRRSRPALVHVHSAKASLVGRFAAALEGIPVLYTVHGWGFGDGRPRLRGLVIKASEYLTRGYVSRYLAVSRADADAGIAQLSIDESKMRIIHNGVADEGQRARPEGEGGFVMVARTDTAKNHEMALRAFGRVDTSLRFVCVGGGTDAPDFVQQALGWAGPAASRLDLLGARQDVGALLAAGSVFILTSRYEGLPLAIIEAMRAGLPVIATGCGGVPELVVDGVTGRLVAPGDVAGAARAMQEFADDPALRRRLGQAGRERFEAAFDLANMSDKLARTYDELVHAGLKQPVARA